MPDEPYIHPERINDRAKLLRHRVVAHYLRRHPELIEKAKAFQAAQKERGYKSGALFEWDEILSRPIEDICHLITSRDPDAYRLRNSSPLGVSSGLFLDKNISMRVWLLARDGLKFAQNRKNFREMGEDHEIRSFP